LGAFGAHFCYFERIGRVIFFRLNFSRFWVIQGGGIVLQTAPASGLNFGDRGKGETTLGISPRPGAGVYFLLFVGALWVPVGHPFRLIFRCFCDFGCQKLRFGCRPVFLWFGRWKSDLSGVAVCGENLVNMCVFERFHFFTKS